MTVQNSTVSGNKATFWGGGIFNDGIMTVSNVTITKNGGTFGGGVMQFAGVIYSHPDSYLGQQSTFRRGP